MKGSPSGASIRMVWYGKGREEGLDDYIHINSTHNTFMHYLSANNRAFLKDELLVSYNSHIQTWGRVIT